jgi:pimeloyl-ACP methyl ester carboxylesterase
MNLLHATLSGAEFVRVEGAGHYLQEECPDAVVRTISRMSIIARAGR